MMSRALTRRAALAICAVIIVAVAARGTFLQRRSLADYDHARSALRSDIARYEGLLVKGEKRSRAAAALQAAGAQIESLRGDIVITVLPRTRSVEQMPDASRYAARRHRFERSRRRLGNAAARRGMRLNTREADTMSISIR